MDGDPAILALGLVPVAVVVAVLRYRLYEIDTLINRTLVYVPLVGIVAGIYAGLVALLQRAFTAVTGDKSDAAAVISALALAAVFTPIRNALQSAVDRRFKPADSSAAGKWDDPEFRAAVEAIVRDVVERPPASSRAPGPDSRSVPPPRLRPASSRPGIGHTSAHASDPVALFPAADAAMTAIRRERRSDVEPGRRDHPRLVRRAGRGTALEPDVTVPDGLWDIVVSATGVRSGAPDRADHQAGRAAVRAR